MEPLDIDLSEVQTHIKPTGKLRKLFKRASDPDCFIFEIDWSSLESFLVCKRSSMWRLVFSRSTYQTPALTYGSAMHAALEVYYRGLTQGLTHVELLPEMFLAGEHHFMQAPPPTGEWRSYGQFCENLQTYLKEELTKPLYPLKIGDQPMVELPFALPLGEVHLDKTLEFTEALLVENGVEDTQPLYVKKIFIVWTGVIDLVNTHNERTWITDHKTTSVAGDNLFKGYEMSQQFRGYQWAAEKILGEPIQGVVANVLAGRKPTKTGKSFELLRRFYPYPRHRIDEWPDNILALVEDFIHSLQTGKFPEETQWCINKYGVCPYFDVCAEAPENRMLMLGSDRFCDNVWNPLD